MRIPLVRVGEEGGVGSADAGAERRVWVVGMTYLVPGTTMGCLDGTEDGVNRGMETEGFLDDGLVEG